MQGKTGEPLPPRAQVLAELLVEQLGLAGHGRVEIEVSDDGDVRAVWTHEKTRAEALGRFDQAE